MKCALCEKTIEKYDAAYSTLRIDDGHSVDVCEQCIDLFLRWQGERFAALFPTKTMKKRYGL